MPTQQYILEFLDTSTATVTLSGDVVINYAATHGSYPIAKERLEELAGYHHLPASQKEKLDKNLLKKAQAAHELLLRWDALVLSTSPTSR